MANETERWKRMAHALSLEFTPGIKPYLERIDLLSALEGKQVGFETGGVGAALGGLVEQMLARIMIGMMHGDRNGHELLVYRDVKQRMRAGGGGETSEYYVHCALVFGAPYEFDFSIRRGRGLFARNRVKLDDSALDGRVVMRSTDRDRAQRLANDDRFKTGIKELFEEPGHFAMRPSGIVFQEKNRNTDVEVLERAIAHMIEVGPALSAAGT